MSTLDSFFEEIEHEQVEKIIQKKIAFAQKQKWTFSRYKKLIDVNLKMQSVPTDMKWDEDAYVEEYKEFCTEMYDYRFRDFTVARYMCEHFEIMPEAYTRVNEDLSIGNKVINVSQ